MNLKNFKKHTDWVKMWSAKGSFHFDSHFGKIWTREKSIKGKSIYQQVIFFYKNGLTDCWATKFDRDDLGNRLSSLARQDTSYVIKISDDLKFHAEKVLEFISSHDVKKINLAEFNQFWDLVYDYYLPHISVKYIVDYVSPEELKNILPRLEKVRLLAEPVYRNIENYVESIAGFIAAKTSYTKEMVIATTKEELQLYFKNNKLPARDQLKNRYDRSALVFDEKEDGIFIGAEVNKIEKIIFSKIATDIIKGQIAYKGIARGRVKIVFNPSEVSQSFIKGDILVTGMTRPDFLPLLRKAAGFITDSGGILSHAAIIARELKKPCIIGTKIATKVLCDGDLIEVNANKGIVKIIKKFSKYI